MPQVANKEENKKVYSEFVFKLFFDADTRERDVFFTEIFNLGWSISRTYANVLSYN